MLENIRDYYEALTSYLQNGNLINVVITVSENNRAPGTAMKIDYVDLYPGVDVDLVVSRDYEDDVVTIDNVYAGHWFAVPHVSTTTLMT